MPDSREDLISLAQLIIEMLEAQKKYFKSRAQTDLVASKQLESKLRLCALAVLEREFA